MEEPEKIVSQTELDDKAQKLVEDKDADSRLRVYIGPMEKTLTAVLLIWAAFQVWANMFGTLGAVKLRTAHIMFLLPLAFTLYPTFKKERRRRRFMPVWDIALIAAAILSYGYLFLRYDAVARTGRLNANPAAPQRHSAGAYWPVVKRVQERFSRRVNSSDSARSGNSLALTSAGG